MSGSPSSMTPALRAGSASSPVIVDVATRARPFDLRRQETIERARLRTLQPMLETVAHRIGGSFSMALRQPVRVEVSALDQVSWEDFATELPDPTFVSSAVLLPFEGRSVLHLPNPVTLLAIDYYLGGDGMNQPDRDQLTEIERALIGVLVEGVWKEIPHPFATFASLNPAMVATSTSATLVQVGRPGTLCLVVRMSIAIGENSPADVALCIPVNVVQALIEQLQRHQSSGLADGLDRREARRRLLTVPVEMKVGFPPVGLTPAELLSLQVGDVIHLGNADLSAPQELELTIEEVSYGTGILVENGKRLACTVLSKIEPTDEGADA